MKYFAFWIGLVLFGAMKSQAYDVMLIGIGGGQKLDGMKQYETSRGDLKLEAGVYSINPQPIMFLQKGTYFGLEVNDHQFRPYIGFSEIIVGFNARQTIPIAYFGASTGVIGDVNRGKDFYSDFGVEGSIWIATLIGALQLSERMMIQEYYQTRIDYIFKFPIFGERAPKKKAK